MKTLSEVKAGLLKDKAARESYAALEDEFSIAHELITVRLKAGLTQTEVAERNPIPDAAFLRALQPAAA